MHDGKFLLKLLFFAAENDTMGVSFRGIVSFGLVFWRNTLC